MCEKYLMLTHKHTNRCMHVSVMHAIVQLIQQWYAQYCMCCMVCTMRAKYNAQCCTARTTHASIMHVVVQAVQMRASIMHIVVRPVQRMQV